MAAEGATAATLVLHRVSPPRGRTRARDSASAESLAQVRIAGARYSGPTCPLSDGTQRANGSVTRLTNSWNWLPIVTGTGTIVSTIS